MNWGIWDATFAAWVAAIAAVTVPVISGLNSLWGEFQQRQTRKMLEQKVGSDLYTEGELDKATRYYVDPDSSNIDPAREEEIRNVVATDKSLFPVLDSFLEKAGKYRHLIILADSGMGKTSALLNYYVRNQRRRNPYKIKLIPLGIPDVYEHIVQVPDKGETIIFLDAFDEDTKAIEDHKQRLRELMDLCRHFNRVVMTCRTQFFPDDEEIPKETGIIRVGPRKAGEGAIYAFHKLYLMPLTDAQVKEYLRKQYPIWRWFERRQARNIVEKIPLLSVRPMLLTHIPDLLDEGSTINYSFELYEAMIEAWLKRESRWVEPKKLRKFSERLAVDLYVHREKRGAERLPFEELSKLVNEWSMPLDGQQISVRSLLNRDADGNLKFAHRSIMEYLFLCCDVSSLMQDWEGIVLTDQMMTFIEEIVVSRTFNLLKNSPQVNLAGENLERVDLAGANLVGANLEQANLAGANLEGITLAGANLMRADLERAKLAGANLASANLEEANLVEANLEQANLVGVSLLGANLADANLMQVRYDSLTAWPDEFDYRNSGAFGPDANLEGANLQGVDLEGINLERADLRGTDLRGANLRGARLNQVRYDSLTAWPDEFDYRNSGAFGPDANLEGANLQGVDLGGASLFGVNLKGADLMEADLRRASLEAVDLASASLVRASLEGADLAGADLAETSLERARYDSLTTWPDEFDYRNSGAVGPNANLKEANLEGADLIGAKLRGANLEMANLVGANLEGASLEGASLRGASLQGANLKRARYDSLTTWPDEFDYRNSGAVGPNANLKGANLRGANLEQANLKQASLVEANLESVKLVIADLAEANLQGANLVKADLRGANLKSANLRGADLTGADLAGANLRGSYQGGADLVEADLVRARYDSTTVWPDGFNPKAAGALYMK